MNGLSFLLVIIRNNKSHYFIYSDMLNHTSCRKSPTNEIIMTRTKQDTQSENKTGTAKTHQ